MRLIESRFLEDCFDGTIMREVRMDRFFEADFIRFLGQYGDLQFFPDFPRPLFIFEEPGRYMLKGSTGKETARIILSKTDQEGSLDHFVRRCRQFGVESKK